MADSADKEAQGYTPLTKHPLYGRYSSDDMKNIFGERRKFESWRTCWIALAEAERELGIDRITPEHIAALRQFEHDVNYKRAEELERISRHDVMSHVQAYGEQVDQVCPGTSGIIHLGATSMYPCDNTELLQMRDGLDLIIAKTINVFRKMASFAGQYADTPCLARTHYQPAQPTTYGKRICDWMYNFVLALERIESEKEKLKGRGEKGTTGTQESFMKLFNGDTARVNGLDRLVCQKLGFAGSYAITTQTYPRVVDYYILSAITGITIAAKKMTTDMRLLQGLGELSEPFGKKQIGSSAMAYKRNPMGAERAGGLSRHEFTGPLEAAMYASEQWLERSLDDSAERRIVIPDTFLGVDAVLNIILDTFSEDTAKRSGFRVYEKRALRNLMEEMPFMVTEELLMYAVNAGGNRQKLHEAIREDSMKARQSIDDGGKNNLLELLAECPEFGIDLAKKKEILNPMNYLGSAQGQCRRFIEDTIGPILNSHSDVPAMDGNVKV